MTNWGPFSVENKRVLVTGGAMGIGWGIAKRYLEGGASVMIADLAEEYARNNIKQLEEKLQPRAAFVKVDLTHEDAPEIMISEMVRVFGGIDILINNAGIYPMVPFLQMTPDLFEKVYKINLRALVFTSRAAVKRMIEQSTPGKIINIASIDSLHPSGLGLTAYDASKGGVWMFTKALALEVAKHGINVNAIAPGAIITEGAQRGAQPKDQKDIQRMLEEFVRLIPLGRPGTPDDIAKVAVFLGSPAADYMTGSLIVADGGRLLS
ncbi:MAG TPA: SDR family NAD(P)-dependent oxidoreductase [Thermoplasmataceae archaeon]|nr:SDR family oxidoreductase [Thermoplasmatales archaeon AK]HLH86760.1 SDR family NAD(P)-dependent oxidoreductase [Thermoplasmataceae archaeon]